MNVTRDIVTDLWPLYQSGEASADTRALVEAFLASDPEFARARRRLLRDDWPLFFAMLFSCMAFGRIVADTSFDVSPRGFIATAALALVFWVVFLVRLARRLAVRR